MANEVAISLSRQTCALWGKTDRLDGNRWLPLYVHMADSVGMAERIWDHWMPGSTKNVLIRNLGDATLARQTYLLLAGIHDIGKATPIFQAKPIRFDPSASDPRASLAWLPERAGLPIRHDLTDPNWPSHPIAGQVILERYLIETCGWRSSVAESYASVIGGHHGTPPDGYRLGSAGRGEPIRMGWDEPANEMWEPVQRELIEFVIDHVGLSFEDLERLGSRRLAAQSESLLTGAVIMADWMASNSDDGMFPLVAVPGTLESLTNRQDDDDVCSWNGLRWRAERAWSNLCLCQPWHPVDNDLRMDDAALNSWFRSRFDLPQDVAPRSVQRAAMTIAAQTEDPGLMIIEAPMGEGKTEAALAAAELLAQRTGSGGICVALPTMATTDAMFGRVHAWLDALPTSPDSDSKTVWLAHGKARLNEEFRGIIAESRRAEASWSSVDMDESGSRRNAASPETIVSEWMWGRKKGVLANFLICTVDQVLMGALQMKHVVLRQLALANKVVVIDECHAYDAYMQEYLERILEWLGGFHTPVILLSATLPEGLREKMTDAYLRGRSAGNAVKSLPVDATEHSPGLPIRPGRERRRRNVSDGQPKVGVERDDSTSALIASAVASAGEAYPLITYSSGERILMKPVTPSGRALQVSCELMSDDDDALIVLLDSLLREGGCVGVICDTVPRAQHVAALLADRYGGDRVRLTHARFVDLDRMDNERELRDLLGPHSTLANDKRPERLIVVGTQVLEQSLDIDFDALITDIAPVDLLMQRLGRVHRHMRGAEQQDRPARLRAASCHIRGIAEWRDGMPRFDDGIRTVYAEASLMESLGVLGLTVPCASAEVSLPKDIAATVRRAYGEHAADVIPESWRELYGKAVDARASKQAEKRVRAHDYRIKSLQDMDKNGDSLVNWFKAVTLDDADDDKGQRAVRDTQETVEVLLLRRCADGIRLLPWIGDVRHDIEYGAVAPTDSVPDDRLALLISQCAVRLPASMSGCKDEDINALISALEQGCGDDTRMWADSSWLAGSLAIFLQDDGDGNLSAVVNGFVVRYDRSMGLVVEKERV